MSQPGFMLLALIEAPGTKAFFSFPFAPSPWPRSLHLTPCTPLHCHKQPVAASSQPNHSLVWLFMIVAVKCDRDNPEEKNMGQKEQIHKVPLASQEELLGVEERREKRGQSPLSRGMMKNMRSPLIPGLQYR